MHDIKLEHIQHIVRASGLSGFTGTYTELGSGGMNDTFLLEFASTKAVLRVAQHVDVNDLRYEARSLKMLAIDHIPQVLFFNEAHQVKDRTWILETYVEGVTPSELTNEHYKKLGLLLAKIHERKHEEQKTFDLWQDLLFATKRFGNEDHLLHHPDQRMRALMNRAKSYFTAQTEKFGFVQEALVHGDVTLSNILVNGNEVGLIDWEFSRFKDPMSDFSTAFYEDMELNNGKWRVKITEQQKNAFYAGYEQGGGTIDHDRIEVWMNHDKLGVASYLWWLIHESGREYPKDRLDQYQRDLARLQESLEINLR